MARSPFHVRREQHHLAWDGSIPPVLRVGSGDEVTFDALDASNGQLTATSTVADLATLDFAQRRPGVRADLRGGRGAGRHAAGGAARLPAG